MSILNTLEIVIRWVDLDPYNHLNNSKYFDFMTEARAKYFWEYSLTNKTHLILHDCHISFKKPYRYPNSLILEQYLEKIDGASFDLFYVFKSKLSNDIHAEAKIKMVTYDAEKNRVCRVPKELISLLEKKNET
ncbi:acyl-CoA thioesterase [Fluviispira sanaruensis]|uniref:Acyl-CoA thioesterase n=1 Tax=Fluviispira sanaruensis TaxID=2493639 RepID=A0A4P2VPX0_FLUSA|nr:thioesterase family protein [Fluviispira sanaruensis]BBH54340.1 acyl-CoA thioesterase [Fluviispira sanaruensis]